MRFSATAVFRFTYRIVPVLVVASLVGSPAFAKCGKDCRTLIAHVSKSCKLGCRERSAGKACRTACSKDRKRNEKVCKAATQPTLPLCGKEFPSCLTTGAACGSCIGGGQCYEVCSPPCALICVSFNPATPCVTEADCVAGDYCISEVIQGLGGLVQGPTRCAAPCS
jgi:hypothetical protein